jgi:phosphoglycolate phosphatase-like HAD superfamily hydrolase
VAVVAVIFDFDDTLLPDSTSALLAAHGIDPGPFWADEARRLVDEGYDPPLAYLRLLLDRVGEGQPLGLMTNAGLRDFGSTLDSTLFDGLPEIFSDLEDEVAAYRDVSVEFYIISGGLEEVILGSSIVANHFDGVYGCQFGEDPSSGLIRYVKRCITFTEKTRFLFEINKGISPDASKTQPHLVNELVEEQARRVPFEQMIYIGDGLTDIPCFSLVNKNRGVTFGVYKRGAESAKQAFQRFLATDRVKSLYSPDYREDADLGAMIRAAVASTATRVALQGHRPL